MTPHCVFPLESSRGINATDMNSKYFSLLLFLSTALTACTQGATAPAFKSLDSVTEPTPTAAEQNASEPAASKPTAGLQKMTYQMGPFDLPAGTSAENMRENPAHITFAVDEAMWITGFAPRLENSRGEEIPGALLHLALVSNRSENNPLCGAEHTGNPLMAATSALKQIQLPEGYGYAVLPEDTLEAQVVLQNPTEEDFSDVYFTFTLQGQPMGTSQVMKDVLPLLLDTDPCKHLPLAVEPGAYLKKTERFTMPEAGSLIAAYGLLQAYGVEIALTKESDAAPFWEADATIDRSYQVTELATYEDAEGISVSSGDGMVLSVAYQNFSDVWFNDATAAAMVYVARSTEQRSQSTAKPYPKKSAQPATSVQADLL